MDEKLELAVKNVSEKARELGEVFLSIQQPRSDYALENFVVKSHCTPERQYLQVVEELRRCYSCVRRAQLELRKLRYEKEQLPKGELGEIERELKTLDEEEVIAGLAGKLREFAALYSLFERYPRYTPEQVNAAEPVYWQKRLEAQAARDLVAARLGVGQGNQEALEQIGVATTPQLSLTTGLPQLETERG